MKINNTDASREEFRLVRSTLKAYDKKAVRGDFTDRDVSSQELQDFFDVDDDGSVELSDILAVEAKLGQGAFLRLDDTLKKHGFAATSFVVDRDFSGYVRGYADHMKRGENVTIPEAERPFWGDAEFVMRAISIDWFALPLAEPRLLQDTDFCRRISDIFFAAAAQYDPDVSGHGSLSLKTELAPVMQKNSFSGTSEMSSIAWWMIGNFSNGLSHDQEWVASVLVETSRFFGLGEDWVDFGNLAALRTQLGEEKYSQLEDQLWWQNISLDAKLSQTSLEPYVAAVFNPVPSEDDLRLQADLKPFLRSSRFVANLVKAGSWAMPDGESVLLSNLLPDDLRLNVPFNLDVLALAPGWRDQMAPELWENFDVLHGALAMSEGWVEGKLLPPEVLRNHAFSLKMVSENPKTYSWQFAALPEMRADREIATAAMRCHDKSTWLENWNHLPKKLKNDASFWAQDREFLLNALQKDSQIWKHAGKLKSDREFQIQAVKTNPRIYFELDAKSRADQDVAFWALRSLEKFTDVKDMWRWFGVLPESLKQDVSFWKKTFSEGYGFFPSSEWNCWDQILAQAPAMREALSDASVAQKLFSHYGGAVYYLGAGFGFAYDSDPESVKIAAYDDALAYSYCSPALQQDTNFCVELALVNFHVIGLYDATMQQQIWPTVCDALKQKGMGFPPEMMTSYSDFMAGLKSFTEFPERFRSFETVYKIYTNNKTGHFNDDKPIVLLAYPKADSNTALDNYPVADALCADDRVHVLYVEIDDDGRLFNPGDNIFQWAMAKGGSPSGNKLILAGHGTSAALGLGSDQYKAQDIYNPYAERQTFDVGDFASNDFSDLLAFLGPKGEWLDLSCSNGSGGETNPDSIANRSAAKAPCGVRLNFTRIPNNLFGLALDEQGAFDIDWWRGSAYETYGTAAIASRGN